MPLVLVITAFIVGNIVSPLYEHVLGPLVTSYISSCNQSDEAFIKEFNTGLTGTQALNQPYLVAYFAREYKLAEDTTKSVSNRCSVAQTILTYADDPEIPDHANIVYAMPASVNDDIMLARSWRTRPWIARVFQQDPTCFLRIGQKIAALRRAGGQAVEATAVAEPRRSELTVPLPAPAGKTVAATVVTQSAPAVGDWTKGPTPGSVVGSQIIKIYATRTLVGQRIHVRNTTLSGEGGVPVVIRFRCNDCSQTLGIDQQRSYTVQPVDDVHSKIHDTVITVLSLQPIHFEWTAQAAAVKPLE